jgi:hypothetical protein
MRNMLQRVHQLEGFGPADAGMHEMTGNPEGFTSDPEQPADSTSSKNQAVQKPLAFCLSSIGQPPQRWEKVMSRNPLQPEWPRFGHGRSYFHGGRHQYGVKAWRRQPAGAQVPRL